MLVMDGPSAITNVCQLGQKMLLRASNRGLSSRIGLRYGRVCEFSVGFFYTYGKAK